MGGVRRRHLDKVVRSFVRAGANLPPEQKRRVEALRVELSRLSTEFANHVLDSTNAWELVLTDEAELEGLPESARAQARAAAQARVWLLYVSPPAKTLSRKKSAIGWRSVGPIMK